MENLYKNYGYTEMYEWTETPLKRFGQFVEFDSKNPGKIVRYHTLGAPVVGITTIASASISNDPDEWPNAYMADEVDDLCLKKDTVVVGSKVYDQHLEMSYIKTYPWEHYVKIETNDYDGSKEYVKRSARREWAKVNLIGRCVVYDDGTCTPGSYCMPYSGNDKGLWGHAIPYDYTESPRFYVVERLSANTIVILNK